MTSRSSCRSRCWPQYFPNTLPHQTREIHVAIEKTKQFNAFWVWVALLCQNWNPGKFQGWFPPVSHHISLRTRIQHMHQRCNNPMNFHAPSFRSRIKYLPCTHKYVTASANPNYLQHRAPSPQFPMYVTSTNDPYPSAYNIWIHCAYSIFDPRSSATL